MTLAAVGAIPANTRSALEYGRTSRDNLGAFQTEMRQGVPPSLLIRKYHPLLYPQQQLLADYLPMLREARFGAFAMLAENPPFREVEVPLEPVALSGVEWRPPIARTSSGKAYLQFRLPEDTFVEGISVAYNVENQRHVPPMFKILWNNSSGPVNGYGIWPTGDRNNWLRGSWVQRSQPATPLTVWAGATVRDIFIIPDVESCTLRLSKLRVLLPAPTASAAVSPAADHLAAGRL